MADDDLVIEAEAIVRLFHIRRALDLWVLQPANHPFEGKADVADGFLRAVEGVSYRFVNFVEVTAPLFRADKLISFLGEYIPRRHEPREPLVGYGIDAWFCQHLLQIKPSPSDPARAHHLTHHLELQTTCLHPRKAAVIDSVRFINPPDEAKPRGREIDTLMPTFARKHAFETLMARRGLMAQYEVATLHSCTDDPLTQKCEALTLGILLRHHGLRHLEERLTDDTLEECQSMCAASRVKFLRHLQDRGVSPLPERQRIANAIGQSLRQPELYNCLPVHFMIAQLNAS